MSKCKVVRTRFVDPYWEILDESEKLIELKPPKVTPSKTAVESMQVMNTKSKKNNTVLEDK